MLITHPPRQTRHKRLVSEGTATPTRTRPQSHGRATARICRPTCHSSHPDGVGGTPQGTVGEAGGYATAKGQDSFSRHAFLVILAG